MSYQSRILVLIVMITGTLSLFNLYAANPQDEYLRAKELFKEIDSLEWHYTNLPKYNEVIEMAEGIINENPDTDIAIKSQYLIVQCYDKQGEYPKKFEAFNKYVGMVEKLKGEEKASQAIKEMADEYFNLGGAQYWDAIKYYKLLVSKYPKSILADYAQYRIGKSYEELGKLQKAIEGFKRVIKEYPLRTWTSPSYIQLGRLYYNKGMYKKAVETLNTFLERYPDSKFAKEALFQLGCYFYMQREYVKAEEKFQSLINIYPQTKRAKHSRGYIEKIEERREKSKQKMRSGKKVDNFNLLNYNRR